MSVQRPTTAALAVLTLGVGLLGTAPVATTQTDPAAPAISWEQCPAQVTVPAAECGRIDVPMEYADPAGPTISVGFVKIPATGQSRGTLFGNPGGPGGDAYGYFGNDQVFSWPDAITSEWDRVAVQPRGLPGSTPLQCPSTANADPVRGQLSSGAVIREGCDADMPGYAASLTTSNTAEDWEMVRRSLDLEQISIMGLSYGTFLGSLYASRYPQHTDRVVLDSAMSPSLAWAGIMGSQQAGYEQALHNFLAWTAERNDTYGLGDTPLAVYQSWSRKVVEESGTNPTVVPPPAQAGDIPPGLEWAGQSGADLLTATGKTRVELDGIVSRAQNPGAVQATSPTLGMTRALLPRPTAWDTLAKMIGGADAPGSPELSEQEQAEMADAQATAVLMQNSIMCNENTVAANPADLPVYAWSAFVTGDPFTVPNALYTSGAGCSGLQPSRGPELLDGSPLTTRPLQIQGTGDPQTPYQYSGELHERMNTQLVTVHGPGHGHVALGNPAVDDIVVEYLRTGVSPATEAPGI